jgi:hypothetical protein
MIDSAAWTGRPPAFLSTNYLGFSFQSPCEECWTLSIGRRFIWTHVGRCNILDFGWIDAIFGFRLRINLVGRLWSIGAP